MGWQPWPTSCALLFIFIGCLLGQAAGLGAQRSGGLQEMSPPSPVETLRVRGQILAEGGGPVAGARIKTDALRGPGGSQFAGQRLFTARTNRNGEWSLLGLTRGLWVLELSAPDYLPHVVVLPIYMMRRPEPVPWDSVFMLLPIDTVASGRNGDAVAQRLREAFDHILAGQVLKAREVLTRLWELSLQPAALCAAGDLALAIREPILARRLFERAAALDARWYRPQLGIGSAAMMVLDFDGAMTGYAAARQQTTNQRVERMLSSAVWEIQQVRTFGRDIAAPPGRAWIRRDHRPGADNATGQTGTALQLDVPRRLRIAAAAIDGR